ncbi:MAG: DNA replication/repair protein RecF [Veillonellaceae bacterium]|nr:DNA replication/repair protein RecF [Veillonellaceae bacterium]
MRILKLHLVDFRNYSDFQFEFEPGINCLYGANGAGKTNILEGLYVASVGKSPRTHHDRVLIRQGAETSSVRVDFERLGVRQYVQVKLLSTGKEFSVNATPVRQKELVGSLQTIFFGPQDLQLIKGGPQVRRRFLDLSLSRADGNYYDALLRYMRILAQRNVLLKERREQELAVWDEQLAKQAAIITRYRLAAVEDWNKRIVEVGKQWSAGRLDLRLVYRRSYVSGEEVTAAQYSELLLQRREQDLRYGYTSVGPQRDDLAFHNGALPLAEYGSQGEQRLAVLAIKICETDYLGEQLGEYPVLLLDDVFSELDEERREQLLAWTREHKLQTIITSAAMPSWAAEASLCRELKYDGSY